MEGVQLDAAAMIGFAGIAIATIQLRQGHRRELIDGTFRIVEQLQSEQARQARFRVREINRKAEAFGWDFDRLESEERATLASVGSLFGFAGALCRSRRIDERMFLDFWANSVADNYRKLTRYREWRLSRFHDQHGSSWAHFDWIARRADRHLARLRRQGRAAPAAA